jgi:hypothetical protein
MRRAPFIDRLPRLRSIVLWAILVPCLAQSHSFDVERSVAVQVRPGHIQMLFIYSSPPGPRTDLFLARHDLDRDGRIDGPEVFIAGEEMFRWATRGIDLRSDGLPINWSHPEAKFRRDRGGSLVGVFFLQLPHRMATDTSKRLHLSIAAGRQIPPTEVTVEAGPGARLTWSNLQASGGSIRDESVGPGQHVIADFALESGHSNQIDSP